MADFIARCLRVLIALSIGAVLLYAANLAGRQATGALYAAYADTLPEQSRNTRYGALHVAVQFDPDNAEYWRQLAALSVARDDLALEDTAYVRSISERPAWPYGWSAAARSLVERGSYGDRLTIALRQSQSLGPNERRLQYTNAVTALAFWYHLDLEQRRLVDPSIDFVLSRKRYAKRLASAIAALDRQALFCEHFSDRVSYGPIWCHHWGIKTTSIDRGRRERPEAG